MTTRTPLRPGDPLPEGWRWVRLGEIAAVKSGGTPKRGNLSYWGGDIPWVKISDITSFHVSSTEETITEEGLTSSSAKLFPVGTILFTIFATIGKVAILDIEAATNQAIAGIFNISESFDTQYLAHYLQFAGPQMANRGRGMAQDNINLTMLRSLEVPLPPLEIQRRIVAWLDEAFSHLHAIKERHAEAEREAAALMPAKLAEVFGRAEKEGWPWVKLGEVASINPRTAIPAGWDEKTLVPFVEMAALNAQAARVLRFELKPLEQVSRGKTRFRSGDILFAKITPSVENGKVGLSDDVPGPLAFGSTEFHVIHPRANLDKQFLLSFLRLPSTRQAAVESMVGATGRRRVPVDFLRNLKLPLPSLETQRRIVEEVRAFEEEARRIQKAQKESRAVLEQIEKSLLAEAFRPERWT